MLGEFLRRFGRDRGGNTAIVFALSLVPIIFLTGLSLDFSAAAQKRIQLNVAADAAALSMVTPTAMTQSCSVAQLNATNIFKGQASLITQLNYTAPTISGCQDGSSTRTVTVSYSASSINAFPNVLALLTKASETTWTITGTSTATATTAPNINFYLLLDNSPSMDIAATTSGINTMVANTSAQGGCALACHETNPTSGDVAGNPNGEDNYTLAKNLGVVTRIENMATATSALMSTASQMMTTNNATCPNGPGCYQMAIFTFNVAGTTNSQCSSTAIQTIYAPNCAPSMNLTAAQTAAGGIDVLEVCSNNYLTCSNNNKDADTDFEHGHECDQQYHAHSGNRHLGQHAAGSSVFGH